MGLTAGSHNCRMFTKTARFYDAIYGFKDYAAEAEQYRALLHEHARLEVHSLLDVACGTGLHVQHLRQWFECEGLDLDEELLRIASDRNPGFRFHHGDMQSFDLGREFDAVVCLFSAIGYAEGPEGLNRALACFARHTCPGGVVLIEPWIFPDQFTPGYLGMTLVDQPDLKIVRMSLSRVHGRISEIDFEYLIGTPEGIERMTEPHRLTLLTHEEYMEAFRHAGLRALFLEGGSMERGTYIGVKP
jgi:SAM-dependent methyltransferase